VCLTLLTAIFPGEPGSAGSTGARDDGSGGDNCSYKTCKAPVKSSPPKNQHPTFYRPDALPQSTEWRFKHHIPGTWTPKLMWGSFVVVCDHSRLLVAWGDLPSLLSALWRQYAKKAHNYTNYYLIIMKASYSYLNRTGCEKTPSWWPTVAEYQLR